MPSANHEDIRTATERGAVTRRRVLYGMGGGALGAVLGATGLDAALDAVGAPGTEPAAAAGPTPAAGEVVVSHRPVYCGVWVPSTAGQYLRLDRTHDQLLAEYGEMWNRNYRMRCLTTYVGGDAVRYSATYSPSTAGQYLRLGRSHDQLLTEYGQMWDRNFRLATLSAYVSNGAVSYDAVYDPSGSGQYLRLHRTHDQFLTTYGEMWNLNFRLTQLVSYVVGGTVYYGGFFHPGTSGQYLRLGRTAGQFLAEYGEMWNRNYRLATVSTHVVAGEVYYNAVYNPGTGGNFLALDRPYDPLMSSYGDMWSKGFRLATLVTEKVEGLSPTRVAQGIRDRLSGNVVGFSAAVATGALRATSAAGNRRTSANRPSRGSSANARINIASINKTITSVAALQLLAARGLTVDDTIAAYLPSDWTRGANVRSITFRHLLTHTSGIREAGLSTSYADLKATIAGGVRLADRTYLYQNQNFALFRVLIPYLDGFDEDGVTDKDTATSNAYLSYLNRKVFSPIGIPTVRAQPESSEPTLCYPFPAASVKGTDFGDWTKLTAGGCLNMSVNELATFLLRLRESTTLLTAAQVTEMTEDNLGWQGRAEVRHGFVNNHGGFLWAPTSSNGNIELNTLICSFSSGAQVAVAVNSPVGNGRNLYQAVIDAYHGAWLTL